MCRIPIPRRRLQITAFWSLAQDPPKNVTGLQYLANHNPFQNTNPVTQHSQLKGATITGNFSQLSWVRPAATVPDPRKDTYGIYLQRFANPNLPYNVTTTDVTKYNPYVTVDYFDQISSLNTTLYDAVVYDGNGGNASPWPPNDWASWGRKQPYVGYSPPRYENRT